MESKTFATGTLTQRPEHRRFNILAVAIGALLVSIACGNAATPNAVTGSYTIGADGALSGSFGVDGTPPINGIKAGIDSANANGGAGGHQIKLIVRDDGSDPTRAVANIREFSTIGVSAMMGFTASAPSAGAAPLAGQLQIPMLATSLANTFLHPVQPYVYTSDADYAKYAAAQVNIVKQLAGTGTVPSSPRIAVFNFATPAGQAWHDAIVPVIKADGFQLVDQEATSPASTDYGPQVARLAAAKPDAILDIINSTGITALTNAMIAAGMPSATLIVGFPSTTSLAFMKALPWKSFIAMSTANFPLNSNVQVLKDARTEAAKLGADPNVLLYLVGYMQALVVVDALKRCGYPCSATQMQAALDKTDLDTHGLSFGKLAFSSSNHAAVTTVGFLKVDSSGSAVTVGKPIDFATI
jgi:ABC-type branched-subunit amino acid transport system substrate-binding protein